MSLGRMSKHDRLKINGAEIKFVNSFTYLGLTITTTGRSFAKHIIERPRKALLAATSIRSPTKLSLKTALALFDLKILPSAAYGVPLIWDKLTESDLVVLDRVKTTFRKQVMGVHRTARNRKVYLLAGCS